MFVYSFKIADMIIIIISKMSAYCSSTGCHQLYGLHKLRL